MAAIVEYHYDERGIADNTVEVATRSFFFFSSRRRHTRWTGDWSSDVCSSDLGNPLALLHAWVKHMAEEVICRGGRGCAHANAAVELAEIGRASCRERV